MLLLNIQKWVIIIATALLGAGVIVGTFLFLFGDFPPEELVPNPVRLVLQTSPLWALVFLLVAVLGASAQVRLDPALGGQHLQPLGHPRRAHRRHPPGGSLIPGEAARPRPGPAGAYSAAGRSGLVQTSTPATIISTRPSRNGSSTGPAW